MEPTKRRIGQGGPMSRADKVSAVLSGLGIAFAASSLFGGGTPETPTGFAVVAPLVAVTYLVAQVAMFLERRRRGIARTLHAVGAVVLALAAFMFHSHISADRVLLAYWIPAVLGLAAAMALQVGHRREGQVRP